MTAAAYRDNWMRQNLYSTTKKSSRGIYTSKSGTVNLRSKDAGFYRYAGITEITVSTSPRKYYTITEMGRAILGPISLRIG